MTIKNHTLEDSQILTRLNEGDKEAFNLLYSKYWSFVYNHAFKRIPKSNLAEDVVQEVFTQLWLRKSYEDIKNLPGYFYIATRNQVFKIQRKERFYFPVEEIFEEINGQFESADSILLYKELLFAYQQMLDKLSPQQKQIFEMKYQQNLEINEIAEKLNISPKTVRNQLGRALSRLRAAINLISILIILTNIKL